LRENQAKLEYLENQGLLEGVELIEEFCGQQIHLPVDHDNWPNPEFITMANRYRQIVV